MADKVVVFVEEDQISLNSCKVERLQEISDTSQESANVLVISDDDDDEIKVVEPKSRSTIFVQGDQAAEEIPPKCPEDAIIVDEKGNSDSPQRSESPRDQTCSVCLGKFDNKAFLDQCFHAFCFYCILQWSEIVSTCPLCKSSFSSIIHTVKSMVDFQQHILPKPAAAAASDEGRRFRYRTTLSGDREHRRRPRQTAWEMRAQRRQAYQTAQRHKETIATENRRMLYTNCLWVQGVSQQGKPKYRDVSPGFFRANPACTHRLVPWLKRELSVLLNDNESHVHLVQQLVMTLINKIEVDSDEFSRQLRPFLIEQTDHFSHEFYSFARSPFDMTAYDERAQYSWPESINRGRPGIETPTVFHASSTGWDTPAIPAIPEGPSHSRWDRDSPPQQHVDDLWSPGSSHETQMTGQCHNRVLSENTSSADVASDRNSMDGRPGTKTLPRGISHVKVESSRSRTQSRSRSRTSRSRESSHGKSRTRSPSNSRHRVKQKLRRKHKRKRKHENKHKHKHREGDEPDRDQEKCKDKLCAESDPAGKPGLSHVICDATARECHGGTVNVIVVSSDSATASPELTRMQHTASTTYEVPSSTGPSRSRKSRHGKSRTRSRSNSRTVSRSSLSSRSRKSRHGKSRTRSRSNTVSRSPISSRSRKSHHGRSRSRSHSRTVSRLPLSSRSRKSHHAKSRSRSSSNSRTVSPSTICSRSRKPRNGKSRTRSRSNTVSRSPQSSRSRKSSCGKSRERSRSNSKTTSADRLQTLRSQLPRRSRSRKSSHGKTRKHSPSESRTVSACPSEESQSCSPLQAKASSVSTELSSVQRSQSSFDRPQSPTVEEMEGEIQELEVRMAEDKKRLLQLLLKQEERLRLKELNGSTDPSLMNV